MNNEVKIDKGIPIHARATNGGGWSMFAKMEVGDSIFRDGVSSTTGSNAARTYGRYHGRRFTVRTVTENGVKGVRIWPIE